MNHTSHRPPMQHQIAGAGTLSLAMALPLAAQASSQLAIDMGCYSCHGAALRDEAPTFGRLSSRLAKDKGDPAAQQKFVDKFRAGEMFGHIDAHERLSPESAKALVRWLADAAK